MAYIGKKPSFEQVRTDEIVVRQGAPISIAAGSTTIDLNVSEKSFVRLTVSGSSSSKTSIVGILAASATDPARNGKSITLKNDSSVDIVFKQESLLATAENRLSTGISKEFVLSAGGLVNLVYDNNSLRWNVSGSSSEITSSLILNTDSVSLVSADLDLASRPKKTSLIELTSGGSSSLRSISAGKSGELLMLVNKTGGILQIVNDDVVPSEETRILTGTGAPVTIQSHASILLAYVTDSQPTPASRWNIVGGTGSGGAATEQVTQTGIGVALNYPIGTPLYVGATDWLKANAVAANTAEVAGLIVRHLNNNLAEVALSGEVSEVTSSAFIEGVLPTRGSVVFLSTTDGKLSVSDVTTVGYVSKPIGIVHNVNGVASVDIMFYNQRGVIVGGVNARTQINLSGSAVSPSTTPIQDVSAYEAGELAGWISINATTDYKFYFQSQFAKNGLGTDYNIAVPQTVGDVPPAGFGFDVTAAGIVRVTLPALPGFVDSYVNYAINAPAVGASLPLSINSNNVYTTYKTVSGAYTLVPSDDLVVATGAVANTITLPTAVGMTGKTHTIKCDLNAGIFLTIATTGGQLIDSSSTKILLKNELLMVVSDGAKWINLSSPSLEGRGAVPLGAIVPVGNISGWALPAAGAIKDGYALCNGQAFPSGSNLAFSGNMPNLSDDRFLQGSSSVAGTGGANTKTLATAELPAHTHSIEHDHGAVSTNTVGAHQHNVNALAFTGFYAFASGPTGNVTSGVATDSAGDHAHTVDLPNFTGTSGSAGSGTAFDIRPKYFNVVYLMRVV